MLSKFSVRKPYTIIVAVVLVIILGFISFTSMSTDLLPSINLPYAAIMTSYPGATPEEVELNVTKPIEQSMATVSNIKTVSSQSSENYSLVLLEFHQSTNMDSVTLEMRENLDLVKSMWTDDSIASPMIMKMNPDTLPVMISSVDVKGMDAYELSAFVEESVLPSFERIEGVASVTAMGLSQEKLKVTIDEDRIALVNDAIASAIDGDINKARAALNQGRSQLNSASAQLNAELQKNSAAIQQGEAQINQGRESLKQADAELSRTLEGLQSQKADLENQKEALLNQKSAVEGQIKKLEDAGQTVPQELIDSKSKIDEGLGKIDGGLKKINGGIAQADAGRKELSAQKEMLASKEQELNAGKSALESEGSKAKAEIAQGKAEIEKQSSSLESQAKTAKEQASIEDIITVDMVTGILAAQNFSMPAGALGEDNDSYTVKVGDTLQTVEEVNDILLFEMDFDDIDDVRLSDVADVTMTNSSDTSYTKVNGNDGVLLMFQKQSDYSTSDVSVKINEEMKSLEKENKGLSMVAYMDQGIYINMVTDSVLDNLLFGGILAIFILFLFLRDLRPTVVVAISIPASVLFALVLMYFTGVTLNIISLSGLALGVGMLVDNSIVVIENIYRLRREGVPPKEAAVEGAKQVSGAITASTLTTICVFFPILFTDGLSKQLFMDMGLTITFSLVASLLVALSLVPSLASTTLRKEYKEEGKFFNKCKRGYSKMLRGCLKHKFLVLLTVTILLFASVYFGIAQGTSFIPESDSAEMSATLSVEKGTTQEELFQMADTFMKKAKTIPEITDIGAMDESSMSSANMGMSMGGSGVSSVSFYFLLDEKKERTNKQVAKDLEAMTKDMNCELAVTTSNMDMSMLGGSGIQLSIKGGDLDKLSDITEDLAAMLKKVEGVGEVTTSMEEASPEVMITVDKDKAMKEGFTVAQVYATVSAAIDQGKTATTMTMDGKDYPVIVVDRKAETMTEEDIKSIPLKADAQSMGAAPAGSADQSSAIGKDENKEDEKDEDEEELTVGDVSTISQKLSPSTITRTGQERYMIATAMVKDDANIGIVGENVKKALAKYDVPSGYSIETAGESVTIENSIMDLAKVILLALVLTYLIMVAQFQSLRSPFIVMFTIPLAFTGGFFALLLTGLDVSVISLLGFLVLTGVVVNNGIVLVDYINQLQDQGVELREAVVLGGQTRIRPILMTAFTTILGLSTMAMGIGMGAEMVQPMAVVCIGGLLYATILTLFVVPVMYEITHYKRKKKKDKKKNKDKMVDDLDEDSDSIEIVFVEEKE